MPEKFANSKEVKKHNESAEKNPEKHLEKLIKHANAYLKLYKKLYEKRKSAYEKGVEKHKKDPKNVPMPFRDPFVVNYEKAEALNDKLSKRQEEKTKESPSDRIKKEANYLWMRTIMPSKPLIDNRVVKGVRLMRFENGENGINQMKIYPNGFIEVVSDGAKPKTYLSPFPDVSIKYTNA